MKLIIFIQFTFFLITISAQNLVPNSGFENTTQDFCGIMQVGDYDASITDWYSPSQGTPDLSYTTINQNCFNFQPNSSYSGPIGLKGPQLPRSGTNLSGIFLYSIAGFEQREYLQIQLNSSLSIGGKYVVECYVSLCDSTEFATDDFGMLLSTQPVTITTNGVINHTPQVSASTVISDIHNWTRICDTIIAVEASNYLTIGNFKSDAMTTLTANPLSNGKPGMYGSYVFVEDVRVERIAEGGVGIEELTLGEKKLLKITDLLGKETVDQANKLLLFIYSDGTIERKYRVD